MIESVAESSPTLPLSSSQCIMTNRLSDTGYDILRDAVNLSRKTQCKSLKVLELRLKTQENEQRQLPKIVDAVSVLLKMHQGVLCRYSQRAVLR